MSLSVFFPVLYARQVQCAFRCARIVGGRTNGFPRVPPFFSDRGSKHAMDSNWVELN